MVSIMMNKHVEIKTKYIMRRFSDQFIREFNWVFRKNIVLMVFYDYNVDSDKPVISLSVDKDLVVDYALR